MNAVLSTVSGSTFPVIAPSDLGSWIAVAGLGIFHGINPAMGWLLAVALGLQEGRRAAVWRALPAIALGHEASVVVAAGLVGGLRLVAAPDVLRLASATLLLAFGAFKVLRPRSHPRWVGMRLGPRDLVLWSFLMASAHGAGLMLVPVLLGLPAAAHAGAPATVVAAHTGAPATVVVAHTGAGTLAGEAHAHSPGHSHDHAGHAVPLWAAAAGPDAGAPAQAVAAALLHTLAMLLAMGLVSWLVYERFGVGILRRAWINLDRVWAGAILVAGVLTLVT
jgi:hypothetical protein